MKFKCAYLKRIENKGLICSVNFMIMPVIFKFTTNYYLFFISFPKAPYRDTAIKQRQNPPYLYSYLQNLMLGFVKQRNVRSDSVKHPDLRIHDF